MHELAKVIVPQLVESAFIDGDLTEKDFDDREKLLKKLRKTIPKNDKDLFFVIIHHPSLLDRAKKAVDKEEWEYAYVFYATYFEHFINEILCIWGTQNGKTHKTIKELIRRINIEDKYTWLLEILGLPKFNDNHIKTIKALSERRNSFIHYKFEPEAAAETTDKKESEWKKIDEDVRRAVTYSKRFRSKIVWNGNKHKSKI